MAESVEHEHRKKLNKIRENLNKNVKDVRDHFAKIEKVKVDALKKIEDMRRFAGHDLVKLEQDIARTGLSGEAREKMASDIALLKREIEDKATELRNRISGTVIPP